MTRLIAFELHEAEWQRLLQANRHWAQSFKPTSTFGKFILDIADMSRDAAERRTHVWTGLLASSHRVNFQAYGFGGGPEAHVFVERLQNPVSQEMTDVYGEVEERRHGFYRSVIEDDVPSIVDISLKTFAQELLFSMRL